MFERFTERARKVVVLAQEEARHFNHNYIGTEHLLLGLLREDEGVASKALKSFNMSLDGMREQIQNIVGYGEEGTGGQASFTPRYKKVLGAVQSAVGYGREGSGNKAPFTPRSKKVLELSLQEALQLGHNYIGTEHLLLGLLGPAQQGEGVAALALSNLEVDPDKVRREVERTLGSERNGRLSYGHSEKVYQARVTEIQAEARFGLSEEERILPRYLQVSLEYTHGESGPDGAGVDPYNVSDEAARLLEAQPFWTLAEGVELVGINLLTSVPEIGQVTVTLSGPQTPSGHDVSTVSVSATFHR